MARSESRRDEGLVAPGDRTPHGVREPGVGNEREQRAPWRGDGPWRAQEKPVAPPRGSPMKCSNPGPELYTYLGRQPGPALYTHIGTTAGFREPRTERTLERVREPRTEQRGSLLESRSAVSGTTQRTATAHWVVPLTALRDSKSEPLRSVRGSLTRSKVRSQVSTSV